MSLRFLQFLTPPQPVTRPEYDGLEFRWRMLTFRPALFKQEAVILAIALVYIAAYFIGKKMNANRANKWFKEQRSILTAQFSRPWQREGLIQDGSSDFFIYSTGRRALTSLHTTLSLRPRHDLAQVAFQFGRGLIELDYKPCDEVELNFAFRNTPGKEGVPDCVWAVVAKDQIRGIKENRWDLTFTKTTDNPSLPPSLTVMSEIADVTTNLLKPLGTLSLPAVLSDPALLPYFRSLSLTDQPRTRPKAPPAPGAPRTRHLILSLALPPPSAAQAVRPLIAASFQLVDAIAGEGKVFGSRGGLAAALRPETKSKLRKVREELARELKEEAGKEKAEEKAEEKAAAKKKAEEERLSKLSASDQKKEMEREKKRLMRKTQGKVKTR
ncbi:hypothetical protein BKA93DRAFT_757884 [Sparassis latifolia]